jgi:hypothetical protein
LTKREIAYPEVIDTSLWSGGLNYRRDPDAGDD